MTNEELVRRYAMGRDIVKYKKLICPSSSRDSSYIKIDWKPRKGTMRRYLIKLKLWHTVKANRSITRMKSL